MFVFIMMRWKGTKRRKMWKWEEEANCLRQFTAVHVYMLQNMQHSIHFYLDGWINLEKEKIVTNILLLLATQRSFFVCVLTRLHCCCYCYFFLLHCLSFKMYKNKTVEDLEYDAARLEFNTSIRNWMNLTIAVYLNCIEFSVIVDKIYYIFVTGSEKKFNGGRTFCLGGKITSFLNISKLDWLFFLLKKTIFHQHCFSPESTSN